MPDWVLIALGTLAGLTIVCGVLLFAIRRELGALGKKRWLAPPSGREDGQTIPGESWMGDGHP
jgi:hypothetical protein